MTTVFTGAEKPSMNAALPRERAYMVIEGRAFYCSREGWRVVALKIEWPRVEIDVVNCLLDPENVRLGFESPVSQREIINDLFANEDAMEIVESIRNSGYFSQEAPIVIDGEDDAVVVLEGNRRMAALKALANPGLVPRHESRIRDVIEYLGQENVDELLFVPADLAPDREAATKVIASIHTVSTRKPWSLLRQAAFYYAQIDEGKRTAEELAAEYPHADIPAFIRMWEMHKVATAADYEDPDVARYAASRRFPMSTLERIYRTPEVQEKLGFSFSPSGSLQVDSDPDDFAKAVGGLIEGMHKKSINSRTLNEKTGAGFAKILTQLPKLPKAGTTSGAGTFKPREIPKKSDSSKSIVPKGFTIESAHPGVQRRFDELSRLNAALYPHAAIDLLRTLLECGLKAYFDDVNDPIPANKGFVMLSNALQHAVDHFAREKNRRLAQLAKSIRDGVANGSMPIAEMLNAANHNYSTVYTFQDVRDVWAKLSDLLSVVLNAPSKE